MNIKLVLLTIYFVPLICYSQKEISRKYYTDKYANKEAKNDKGKYLMTKSSISDSIIQIEYTNTKTGIKLWTKKYLKDKPYGVWKFYNNNGEINYELDYQFNLTYGEYIPDGYYIVDVENKKLKNEFHGKFEMPTVDNEVNGYQKFIQYNLRYPRFAAEKGISGRVFVQFTIDKNGKVGNISIIRGVHESLDRESFRVVNSIPDWTPAKLNGETIDVYLVIPIIFVLV